MFGFFEKRTQNALVEQERTSQIPRPDLASVYREYLTSWRLFITIRWQAPAATVLIVGLLLNGLGALKGDAPVLKGVLIAGTGALVFALIAVLHRINIQITRLTCHLATLESGMRELRLEDGRTYFEFCKAQNVSWPYKYTTFSAVLSLIALVGVGLFFLVWGTAILAHAGWNVSWPDWLPDWFSRLVRPSG